MAVSQTDVYGTSAWQTGHAQNTASFANVLRKYGIVPDAATLARFGLGGLFDQGQADAANANPDSLYSTLGKQRDTSFASNMNNANAHGALFSGARVNSADQIGRDYQANLGRAGQEELDALLGVAGQDATLYSTIYGQLLSQPTAADPTPAPGSGLTVSGSGTAADPTIVSNPAVPNPTTPSGTATGGWHVPDTTGAALVVNKPKPKPVVGGMGHVT